MHKAGQATKPKNQAFLSLLDKTTHGLISRKTCQAEELRSNVSSYRRGPKADASATCVESITVCAATILPNAKPHGAVKGFTDKRGHEGLTNATPLSSPTTESLYRRDHNKPTRKPRIHHGKSSRISRSCRCVILRPSLVLAPMY